MADMDRAVGSVPIVPGPVAEAVQHQYVESLRQAQAVIGLAADWGRLHPEVSPSQVDDIRGLLSVVISAIDAVTGPVKVSEGFSLHMSPATSYMESPE